MGKLSRLIGKRLSRVVVDYGDLPRWENAEQGQWVLYGPDAVPVAVVFRLNPEQEDPFAPDPTARFYLTDARSEDSSEEIFDSLGEAQSRGEEFLPPGTARPTGMTKDRS